MKKGMFVARRAETIEREIRSTLRTLFYPKRKVFANKSEFDDHLEAYVAELVRLRNVYAPFADASPVVHAVGFIHYMMCGLDVQGQKISVPDVLLKKLVPRASAIESVTKGVVTRRMFTHGAKYVQTALDKITAVTPELVIRPHDEMVEMVQNARKNALARFSYKTTDVGYLRVGFQWVLDEFETDSGPPQWFLCHT